MDRTAAVALGVAGGVAAVAATWTLYQRFTTETVPYAVVCRVDDVELRRYPPAVVAETVADTRNDAFGRLFGYITGANEGGSTVSMTAPVAVSEQGTQIEMTSPVQVEERRREVPVKTPVEAGANRDRDEVRMAFYLPPEYDLDAAPRPTDEDVDLRPVPERTLAVRRFSWRPTDRRVAAQRRRLLETLDRARIPITGDPFSMGYDAPWTLPFLRRNEVAVAVEANGG